MNRFLKSVDYNTSSELLKIKLIETLRKHFDLRMNLKIGKLKQLHLIRLSRRNIALIKTYISKNENIDKNNK